MYFLHVHIIRSKYCMHNEYSVLTNPQSPPPTLILIFGNQPLLLYPVVIRLEVLCFDPLHFLLDA